MDKVCLSNLQRTKQYYSLNDGHAYVIADCYAKGSLNRAYNTITKKHFESADNTNFGCLYMCSCSPQQSKRVMVSNVHEQHSVDCYIFHTRTSYKLYNYTWATIIIHTIHIIIYSLVHKPYRILVRLSRKHLRSSLRESKVATAYIYSR